MRTLLLVLLVFACCSFASAETWVASDSGTADRNITFTLENGFLTVNRTSYGWSQGQWPSWEEFSYSLDYDYASRPWFRCVDSFGNPDSHATFVETPGYTGHIVWAAGTPVGYQANLRLGGIGPYPTNLYLLYRYYGGMGGDYSQTYGIPIDHTFTATYVPEPSCLAAIAAGLGTLGLTLRRRR